jgi:hypothetical protein
LLATLIANGTNRGLATMAHSVEGMTADILQELSQWCLPTDTLKAANAILVNTHHRAVTVTVAIEQTYVRILPSESGVTVKLRE